MTKEEQLCFSFIKKKILIPSLSELCSDEIKGEQKILARSILSVSNIPGFDYSINPYIGCVYGCSYCYASYMNRFLGKELEDWGNYVLAKVNIQKLLVKELNRLRNKNSSLFISSMTDPYQPVEKKLKLTRCALKILVQFNYPGPVTVLTKSPLVTRDYQILKLLNHHVGVSLIPNFEQSKISFFENSVPSLKERLNILKIFNKEGLNTFSFVGPLFPYLIDTPEVLIQLFQNIYSAGTRTIFLAHLNLHKNVRERMVSRLRKFSEESAIKYYLNADPAVKKELGDLALKEAVKAGLRVNTGRVI